MSLLSCWGSLSRISSLSLVVCEPCSCPFLAVRGVPVVAVSTSLLTESVWNLVVPFNCVVLWSVVGLRGLVIVRYLLQLSSGLELSVGLHFGFLPM